MAICGDTRKQENLLFFVFFLVVALWRYVAIPQKFKKTVFFEVFFLRLWRCGDMWRYPKTRKSVIFCIFLVVALWRYVAIPQKLKKQCFLKFFFPKAVALWRYVAICGDTRKQENLLFFVFFWLWRCGDMWRYPKN